MPSGKRYRVTFEGILYDISQEQFAILSTKTLKLRFPLTWNNEQRVKGLRLKGLLEESSSNSKSITYKRTVRGGEVYKALVAKS